MNNTENAHDYKSGEGNKELPQATIAILALVSIVAVGAALFGFSNLSYEKYCQEPQAQCSKNHPASTETFSNIYRTLTK